MGTSKVFETADVYDVMGISKHDVIDVAQQILWEEGLAGDPDTHPSAIVHRPDKHGWEHSIVAANDERAPWAYARIVRGFARATGRLSEVKKAIEQASKRSAAATKAAETRAANRQAMYDAQHAVWMERHAAWLAERRAKEEALAYEAVRAKDQLMVVEQPTVVSAPEVKQELTIK
jgi:hypothetical protein